MRGRVFVIGLGLIGGSLALSVKRTHGESTIIGFDVCEQQAKLAKMLGVVDETTVDIKAGAMQADLIILATPVKETEIIIQSLANMDLKQNVIVTDAGSTKAKVVEAARCLAEKGFTFIGGHPMAGSHKSGVTAAKEILFENAFYLLTPSEDIGQREIATLKAWLSGTKAKFLIVSPEEHDYMTGVISHFPHIIAASLVHQAERTSQEQQLVTRLAAGGFRDITRIASSSPEMWRDILLHNKPVLLDIFQDWINEMKKVTSMLENENGDAIYHYFLSAKQFRDEMPIKDKGAIPAFYDLFVDIPDYPGVISEITGYLAKENISITNIRIRETREEVYGILVISFQTDEDRQRADNCIKKYTIFDTSVGP
ncbi:prephenate dehydrogenase [Bacillus sp. DNRA2]|uniref:prephenate dehydrogenase n=1 Tax=Bacillus sp. DNRA2 TaxID=2723053 RepID=UPI00145E8D8F|nr:prephenate dehydrogenase [Bacillus sp. DNRA2]NMD70323.1 prephenate dehydrogenase [Bacillus sp. DNRA2]